MAREKRRDNKGRLLQLGEYQDAQGRYSYKYMNLMRKRKTVYSWRLIPTDPTPYGTRPDRCLRDKIKEIEAELLHGLWDDDMNVCDLVNRYLRTKTGVKRNTQENYKYVQNVLAKEPFGQAKVKRIKLSDAKLFFIKLQSEGKGYSVIHVIRGVLRPAFQMAMDDDVILRNPFDFQLATVIVNDSEKRQALSPEDKNRFLEFVKADKHYSKYYDGMFILFETGLRISEFCGLTKKDIDFENGIINVDHQLLRTRSGKCFIDATKTTCGTRRIPMTKEVEDAFRRVIAKRRRVRVEPMIDGYSGFLFLDNNKKPMLSTHWQNYFKHVRNNYNSTHPLQLPKITPHICRHTYCTDMARAGMNPKALQYLMGHADISVTMNIYTHLQEDDAKAEMVKMGLIQDRKVV